MNDSCDYHMQHQAFKVQIIWDQALALFSMRHKPPPPTVQTIQVQHISFSVLPSFWACLPESIKTGKPVKHKASVQYVTFTGIIWHLFYKVV